MPDKLTKYREGLPPQQHTNRIWPLYAAGTENLGRDGAPITVAMPEPGPEELLVRHDACGLCFSDIKVIRQGAEHPRIRRDIRVDPVVLGHEVCLTVVKVGDRLKSAYRPGDRFIVQADIWVKGANFAYGYMIQGGLSEFGIIDQRVLNGDDGNYLIPVKPETGYAESALTEPWACVTAAYELKYRTGLKSGGTLWVIGGPGAVDRGFNIGSGFDRNAHPANLWLTNVPTKFDRQLRAQAAGFGVQVIDVADAATPPAGQVDDLVLLDPTADLVELAGPRLADHGVCALVATEPLSRKVSVDIGRVHYNRWVYVGSPSSDVADAYASVPVRATLKSEGRVWFVGAGGPMGRMHVQRAIQVPDGPQVIVCSDVSDLRLGDLSDSFAGEAAAKGIEFICLNPTNAAAYAEGMARFRETGFDDIIVLAPVPPLIAEASRWLAARGVMNVFAGVGRGTMAQLDLSDAYLRQARVIGHSASSIEDLQFMLYQAETGTLSPNRSVAAVGSLEAARDGLQSVMDTTYSGKVVIYPHIRPMPLTSLAELKESLPTVYALLRDGREWTNEAEAEFLRLMLKDEEA